MESRPARPRACNSSILVMPDWRLTISTIGLVATNPAGMKSAGS